MYPPNYSAKDTAITQRPPSSALLCIDAADRYTNPATAYAGPGVSAYDFRITRPASIMNGFFTRVGVSEVVFPWATPNVNINTRSMNVFHQVIAAGVPGPIVANTITLPVGFYTPSALAAALQVIIRALDPGALGAFTLTYGAAQGLPNFVYDTNTVAPNITVIGFGPIVATQNPIFGDSRRKQLVNLLGFTSVNGPNLSVVPPLAGVASSAGQATFCQYTRYVDIVCSEITNNQALKDTMTQLTSRDSLCRVYLGDSAGVQSTVPASSATFCPPGCAPTTIYKNYSVPKYIQWLPNQPVPGSLRFEVFDEDGFNLADATGSLSGTVAGGADWSMTMLVSEN